MDLSADLRTRRLASNVLSSDNCHIVKTAGIYGGNNCGKTSFIRGVDTIKRVLLGRQEFDQNPNLFSKSSVSSFSISFHNEGSDSFYEYSFSFDARRLIFPFEKLTSFSKDSSSHRHEKVVFERDVDHKVFILFGKDGLEVIPLISPSVPLMYGLSDQDPSVKKYRGELARAGDSIEIVSMYNIPLEKTLNVLKNGGEEEKKAIVSFVKAADLSLKGLSYDPSVKCTVNNDRGMDISEEVFRSTPGLADRAKLFSVYGDKKVPSMIFDSTGTKKIEALSSYVIEALTKGKTLFVDELDSGLHFRITRAIVSLFNNIGNVKGQMIFTTHDVMLLNTKRIMRKEQIWFIEKEKDGHVTLYPLSRFTAAEGTRETSDLVKEYSRGEFATIPEPDFITVLLGLITKKGK